MMIRIWELKEDMTPDEIETYMDKRFMDILYRNVQLIGNKYQLDSGTVVAMRLSMPDKLGVPHIPDEDEKAAAVKVIGEIAEDTEMTVEY